jgi:hypothetical protein
VSSVLSFYIDGTIVQAVRASVAGGKIAVSNVASFPCEDLVRYLATCRDKSCILCYNPAAFFHDIVYLPSAAGKFYDGMVRAEVRKNHDELSAFSLFHRTVGETTHEGALYKKIAAFSYPDAPLSEVISKFNRRGMDITRLYAAPYPLFRLAAACYGERGAGAHIFIAALPGEKLFLLSENNELAFLRKLPSDNTMLLPADVANLNMTIDYCFQSLRVRPTEAIMLNPREMPEETTSLLSVPFKSLSPLVLAGIPREIVSEYLAPLAAVLHFMESPDQCDILPSDYVTHKKNRKVIGSATVALVLLALLLGVGTVRERLRISELRFRSGLIKTALDHSGDPLAQYRKLDQDARKLEHVIDYLNRGSAAPNPEAALALLNLPKTAHYAIKAVSLQPGADSVGVLIEGGLNCTTFQESQATFEGLVVQLKNLPGYTVTSSSVDVTKKTFSIEARYGGVGHPKAT